MSRETILVTGAPLHENAQQMITEFGYQSVQSIPYSDEDSLRSFVTEVDPVAILVRVGSISAAVIRAAPSLRVISKHGSGVDNIDIGSASSRGIPVVVTTGANAQSVAEHTMALTLAVVKDLLPLDKSVREGRWEKSSYIGRELRGMKLGLVGYGAAAQCFAPLALATGLSVRAYDPFIPESEFDNSNVGRVESVEELLRQANIVSFHCPLTPINRHILDAEAIALMKHGSFVINTARGGLIDEDALLAALATGQIAGAGLDTFSHEPPRKLHRFIGLSNAVLTPHIAGCTEEAMERVGTEAVLGIHAVLTGKKLSHLRIVNFEELASAGFTWKDKQVGQQN